MEELKRLRVRLAVWYVGVFALVLLAFGAALFAVLTRQISARLDDSLVAAADELQHAVLIRQREGPPAPGRADALDELRIPGRGLYVFDGDGRLLHPAKADAWVRSLAVEARREGRVLAEHEFPDETTWRALARRFTLPDGPPFVIVVTADALELDDAYAGLLLAFSLAALLALVVVGAGGWLVARRSTEPIRDAFQRMRGFMADAAHELRTPVAVMEGHAEVALRQRRESDEYVEVLGAIHGEAVRLGGILENLLTIARADAAAWPVRLEPLYLDDLLLDVAENARALAARKGVSLQVVALDELPVRGDPDLLRQLVMILLDNAVKFSPDGQPVSVAGRREGGRAELSVEDLGPGIEPDVLPHVFERFYRGDKARGRAPGAGLGLPIARWIADVHGATIDIHTRPGHGTRVTVSFALQEVAA